MAKNPNDKAASDYWQGVNKRRLERARREQEERRRRQEDKDIVSVNTRYPTQTTVDPNKTLGEGSPYSRRNDSGSGRTGGISNIFDVVGKIFPPARNYRYDYGDLVPPGPGMKPGEDFMQNPDFLAEAGLLNREYMAALEDYRQRLAINAYEAEARRAPVRRNIEIEQLFGPQGQAAIGEVYGNLQGQLGGMLSQVAAPYEQAANTQQAITGSATGSLDASMAAIQNQLQQQAGLSGVGYQNPTSPAGTAPVDNLGALQLALQQQTQGGGENIAAMQGLGAAEQNLTRQAISGYGTEAATEQGYLQDEVAAAIANLQAELAGIQASPVPFNMEDINIPHERSLRDLMKTYMDRQKAEQEDEPVYTGLRGAQEYLTRAGVPELNEDFMDKWLAAQEVAAGSAGEKTPEEAFLQLMKDRGTKAGRFGRTVSQIHPDEYQRLAQTYAMIMQNQYGGFE